MLVVRRDADGELLAVCEWWLVGERGEWNPLGRYVWVNQLELGPLADPRTMIREIRQEIARLAPRAVGAYWERREKPHILRHAYRRERLVEEVKDGCVAVV